MKKGCRYCHSTGLLLLRLLLASVFMFHVLPKFSAGPELMAFVGWVPTGMWLTLLSATTWFYVAMIGELFVIITALLWRWTRVGSVVIWILMFFAMAAKHWMLPSIELEIILTGIALVLFVAWPGKYSMTRSAQQD